VVLHLTLNYILIHLYKLEVDLAVEDIKNKEEHDIMLAKTKSLNLTPLSPLQEQVSSVFTRFSFQMFQEEFQRSA
jgi:hypothetical protein